MNAAGTGSILDAPTPTGRASSLVAGAGAVVVHGAFIVLAVFLGARVVRHAAERETVTQMIEVDLPPAAEPVAEAPRSKPARLPAPPKPTAEAPPPAAAQAAQVLADADEIIDFGDAVVVGKGDRYAGGVTEAAGTASHAVRDTRARASGVEAATGAAPAADRSRPPRLAGGAEWDCPFPPESDQLGIDHAVVTLRIEVGADGRVAGVRATSDPGDGFGREARRCAMDKPWDAGLDRAGNPTVAVAVVNVRFDR
jgi:periplasmic protein TonB